MKKLIITCALLTCASIVSFGQTATPAQTTTSMAPNHAMPQPPTVEQRAERRARGEEKQLTLTPEQYKSVYAIELDAVKKMEALRTGGGQPSKDQYMAINASREEQIKKVLTPEQATKFDAMSNRQHPPTGAPAPAAPTPAK